MIPPDASFFEEIPLRLSALPEEPVFVAAGIRIIRITYKAHRCRNFAVKRCYCYKSAFLDLRCCSSVILISLCCPSVIKNLVCCSSVLLRSILAPMLFASPLVFMGLKDRGFSNDTFPFCSTALLLHARSVPKNHFLFRTTHTARHLDRLT